MDEKQPVQPATKADIDRAVEKLALMINEGFKTTATKDDVKLILSAIENLSGQIADVKQSTLSAIDFVRLEERVDVIEKKLGIVR